MNFQTRCIAAVLSFGVFFADTADGQVIQLPSYHQTGYSGTVSIPDSGTGYLGGSRYSRSGRRRSALSRSSGFSRGGSAITASVQIIDLKALDDAILAGAVAPKSGVVSADSPAADGQRNYLGPLAPTSTASSLRHADDRWHRTMAGNLATEPSRFQDLAEAKIRDCLRRGKAAEMAGRVQAARVYYRMAIEAMTPEMHARYQKVLKEREEARKLAAAQAEKDSRKSF